jgi:hypothetical protein
MKTFSSEKFWNIISLIVYACLVAIVGYVLVNKGIQPMKIPVWEWIIMSLATYRLTRLLVYDRIFKFFRDFTKISYTIGFFVSLKNLITCPWCAGVWAALVIICLEFLVPYGIWLNYLLAIAGTGTLVLVVTNILGLSAEKKQIEVMKERRFDHD